MSELTLEALQKAIQRLSPRIEMPELLVMNKVTWRLCRRDHRHLIGYGWHQYTGRRLRFFGGIRVHLWEDPKMETGKMFPIYSQKLLFPIKRRINIEYEMPEIDYLWHIRFGGLLR